MTRSHCKPCAANLKMGPRSVLVIVCLLWLACSSFGQTYNHRGFLENRGTFYPQKAANDAARGVSESLLRYEAFYTPSATLQFAGALDFRMDTHHQVKRDFNLSWQDREVRRPIAAVR